MANKEIKKKATSYKKGNDSCAFTLVEMIVSLGIFAVVAVVALGALVRIITANQKAQSLQAAMTNLNFALESMSREIRVGTNYVCFKGPPSNDINGGALTTTPCSTEGQSSIGVGNAHVIAFNSTRAGDNCNLINAYRFIVINDGGGNPVLHLQKAEQNSCNSNIRNQDFFDMLSNADVILTDYRMGVNADHAYPYVFIRLMGYAGAREREKTYFDIQTTVSSRVAK